MKIYRRILAAAAAAAIAAGSIPAIAQNVVSDDYAQLMSGKFNILDRTGWSAYTNSQQSTSGGNSVGMVLDGNVKTIWHSSWTNAKNYDPETNPVYLVVDMGEKKNISGIKYTPRVKDSTSGSVNGVITAYEVYASDDNTNWNKIGEGNMNYSKNDSVQEPKDIIFKPTECQYIKLVVKGNLYNGTGYVGSCAEFDVYSYDGTDEEHPVTEAINELNQLVEGIDGTSASDELKNIIKERAAVMAEVGTVDSIKSLTSTVQMLLDAQSWIDEGIDDVYLTRLVNRAVENNLSADAVTEVGNELKGFYALGSEAKERFSAAWQDEFTMSEADEQLPLYERIKEAINNAKARIDSNDGKDYKMLKELVSYASGMYSYEGYENHYGMSADRCEAIVNNINFTLANLEKIDNGELSTELTSYKSGEMWLDDLGSKISAHGGQIIKQGDTYYWYGEDNKIAYDLTTGVSCYSSKDLKNWTYEGLAFKAFDDGTEDGKFTDEFLTDTIKGTRGRIERPKVIYNENTGKYVMWMHLEKNGNYALSIAGVATADSPTGPFTWQWYGRPVADTYVEIKQSLLQTYRDMNLFVDDDGTAYAFYSSENNKVMYAVRLNKDYTWIDTDGLEISGSTEADIKEGAVIVPDMTTLTSAKYNYGKPSFTRYQLASGGAMQLQPKKDSDGNKVTDENGKQIYVSERSDGRLTIPVYEDGRWARVGQNTPEENMEEGKTETIVNNSATGNREAPAVIKRNGKYYNVTSALSGWKANPSQTQVSDSVLGTWTVTGNPMTGNGPSNDGRWSQEANTSTSFNSQSTCVLELPNGSLMYMGDRWKNGVYETSNSLGTFPDVDVKASTYVWLPITFENDSKYGSDTLKVRWYDSWNTEGEMVTPTPSTPKPTATPEPSEPTEPPQIVEKTWNKYSDGVLGKEVGDNTIAWKLTNNNNDRKGASHTVNTEENVVTITTNDDTESGNVLYGVCAAIKGVQPNTKYTLKFKEKTNMTDYNNNGLYINAQTKAINWSTENPDSSKDITDMKSGKLTTLHNSLTDDSDWCERTITYTTGSGKPDDYDTLEARFTFMVRGMTGTVQIKDLEITGDGVESPSSTATPTTKPTEEPTATPTMKPTEEPTATPTTKPDDKSVKISGVLENGILKTVKTENITDKAVMYAAQYDSKGKLTVINKIEFEQSGEITVNIPANGNIKLMLWNENNEPLCEIVNIKD